MVAGTPGKSASTPKARTPSKASPAGTRSKAASKDSVKRKSAASPEAAPASEKKPKKKAAAAPAAAAEPVEPPKKRKAATPSAKAAAAEPSPAPKRSKAAAPKAAKAAKAAPAAAGPGPSGAAGSLSRLDLAQVQRAVEALGSFVASKGGTALVDEDAVISVVLATKRMPKACAGAKGVKPRLLTLPHAWRELDATEVCLIVKDPQRVFKDMCAAEGIGAKVIGVEKLKKKYVPFEAKRKLRAAYDFFAADERVIPLLPKLLGSEFYKSNKLPLPINLKRKGLRECLQRAVGGAILRPTFGTCQSLACASSAQQPAHAAENIMAAVEKVVARTPGKWQNIQAIHVRTADSAALPVYNSL